MPRSILRLSLVSIALGLAACGSASPTAAPAGNAPATGSPATSAASAALDPCAIATSSDVSTAVGGPVGAGVADTSHAACTFAVTGATLGTDCVVKVDIPAFPTNRSEFNANEQQGGAPQIVSGIGDAAYNPEQGNAWVQFVKGDQVVDVMLTCTSDPDSDKQEAAVETLAKAVAAKI